MKPLNPDVYRRAAELVAGGGANTCCFAIRHMVGTLEGHSVISTRAERYVRAFAALFRPEPAPMTSRWMGRPGDPGTREHRVIALLTMAEVMR